MRLNVGGLNAIFLFFFFFLALVVDKGGVYRACFYISALVFLFFIIKDKDLFFEEGSLPFSLLLLVLLVVYLVLSNISVLGIHSSYRAFGNSIETIFFVFMAYSASLFFLNNRAVFSNLYFLLVFVGFASIAYACLMDEYNFQRVVGPGFLSKAILGPSVLFVYWLLGCFLFFNIEARPKDAVAFFMATVCLLVYALLSQSRGPIIAVVVSGGCVFFASFFYNDKKRIISSLVALLLSFLAASYVLWKLVPLSSLFERGSSYRPEIWAAVIESSKERFWLGNGVMGEFREGPANKILLESIGFDIDHAHNTFIQLFYDGGFIGLFVFVAAMAVMAYEVVLKKSLRKEKFWVGFVVIGMVMINFTDTSKLISSPKEAWIMFWLPLAFIAAWVSKSDIDRNIN